MIRVDSVGRPNYVNETRDAHPQAKETSPWAASFPFCTVQSRTELSAASPSTPSRPFSIKGNSTRTVRDFFSHCSAINIVAIAGSYGCSFSRPGGFTDGSIGPRRRALMRRVEFRQAPLQQLIRLLLGASR